MTDFATFLLERRVVSHGDVLLAVERQMRSRPTIGRLACELRMLTAAQVFTVLAHQAREPQLRFGEAAIAIGLLKRTEVDDILLEQRRRTPRLDKFLVDAGVLDPATALELRAEYDNAHPSTTRLRAVPRPARKTG